MYMEINGLDCIINKPGWVDGYVPKTNENL